MKEVLGKFKIERSWEFNTYLTISLFLTIFPIIWKQSINLHCKPHDWIWYYWNIGLKPFQPIVVFHMETRHLTCTAMQVTGFYMKFNIGLK